MILVDTSVWIDHFSRPDPEMDQAVAVDDLCCHPFVVGEVSMGAIPQRAERLRTLLELPMALEARDPDVLELIERRPLWGRGLSFVDAHLLAAALISDGVRIWTRDRRLDAAAVELGVAWRR